MCTLCLGVFSYQNSAGCELTQWPSLAWWVLSWVWACPRTERAGSAHTWLDTPWFPTWQTHTIQGCKIGVWKNYQSVQTVTDLPEWPLLHWCPDHWLRRWGCLTHLAEEGWKESGQRPWIIIGRFLQPHCFTAITAYTVITLSLGWGGRPTVSCLWWEIRSVQACRKDKYMWNELLINGHGHCWSCSKHTY